MWLSGFRISTCPGTCRSAAVSDFGPFCGEGYRLCLISQYLQTDAADVEQYRHDVFTHAFNGGEFVRDAGYFDVRDRGTRQGREDYAAKAVAQGVAVARVKPVDLVRPAPLRLGDDAGLGRQRNVVVGHIKFLIDSF